MSERRPRRKTGLRAVVFNAPPLSLRFRLPGEWEQSFDEEEQCGRYAPPHPEALPWTVGGELSLWLDLNREARPARPGTALALLERQPRSKRSQLRHRGDNSFVLFDKTYHRASSQRLVDYLWQLAQAVPRRGVAVATFGFTALAELYDNETDRCYGVIELLDREISKAELQLTAARAPRCSGC